MPQPNVQQGRGRLRRRRQEQAEAYVRSQANQRADARDAEGRAQARARVDNRAGGSGGSSSGGGAPAPAAPKYGPSMRRARADAQFVYGDAIQRAQAGVQNAGNWWDQYKQDVASQQQATAARYAQAQQQVSAATPQVGPAVSGPEGAQAAQSRGMMQQAFGNLLTAQGAAQQDYFGGRLTVGSAQQLQSRVQGDAQVQQLAKERDAYTVQQRGKYRDQKHQRRLENAAFGLDQQKAQADVLDDVADNRRAAREDRRERRENRNEINPYGYRKADWAKMSPAERRSAYKEWQAAGRAPKEPGAEKNPFNAKDQAKSRQTFRKVFQDIKKNDNGVSTYGKDIQKTLTGAGADSLLVRAAWQLYNKGRVAPGVARALKRDYGITVKPRAPRKRPEPSTPFPEDSPGSDAAQG
jgi:hypothetical protein